MAKSNLNLGIDIGSTTIKLVLTNTTQVVLFKAYRRHNTQIKETLSAILREMSEITGDVEIRMVFTGSGGINISQVINQPFIQETIAASESVKHFFPEAKALIDIGGEDCKLIFYNDQHEPDIRMNGNCAGGTGAFIDQMAALLHVPITELDPLAKASKNIYPIASRCGVFAKTDIQNLISRKITNEDIAASIFYAVASQVINSLVRGFDVEPKIVCSGGPLRYITYLRKSFADILKINIDDILVPEDAEIFTALGASTCVSSESTGVLISELIKQINTKSIIKRDVSSLTPLFKNKQDYEQWTQNRHIINIKNKISSTNEECYIGIDSGSTTTKIVVINKEGDLLFNHYVNNQGNPLNAVVNGLNIFADELKKENKTIHVVGSAVTGYGEDLIRTAVGMDHGIVETIAHYLAARKVDPKVSFILDIGGQDIKAIFIQNDTINHIEINEACSSGCGSFIENFATTLGHKVANFAQLACESKAPYDLGSRCTVFMNSKVKQAFKDGASVSDLSAGLAYSVVKNCLFKVLKISNLDAIGNTIVVQGGTLKNQAVVRALELLSDKKIISSDKPELMGAYGAALYAFEKSKISTAPSKFIGLDNLTKTKDYTTKFSNCKGCTNNCYITTFKFPNGNNCFSGNKCEKVFTNSPDKTVKGENIFEYKKDAFFKRAASPVTNAVTIGIPRILNMYDDYPFWHTLFTSCGLNVELSSDSNDALYKKGYGSIMADNICFPAKISHGHVVELIEKNVDRIFYPMVVFTQKEHEHSSNCFNCPIVSGYSEVLKDTLPHHSKIKFDSPAINFKDEKLLKKACIEYLSQFKISKSTIEKALALALEVHTSTKKSVQKKNVDLLRNARANNVPIVLLAGHPYHMDHMVHQQISQMLADLGVCVINEDIAEDYQNNAFDHYFTISQWAYPNRILQAAQWLTQNNRDIEFIQLNSFGCGTDAFIVDEISDLLKRNDKSYTLIRIDEISSPGSVKLRLRSLVESVKLKNINAVELKDPSEAIEKVIFTEKDQHRKILVPWFSDFVSPFIPELAKLTGIELENLPPSDQEGLDHALKYTNNEVCYPALLVVGDILKAVKSGKHNLNEIAIGITQTGGQCRATNYIALIKRALDKAGYPDIPVVSIAAGSSMQNTQPGFKIDWLKIVVPTLQGLFFSDSLARMYNSTRCRELHKGTTEKLKEKYIELGKGYIRNKKHNSLPTLLKEAVKEFNTVPTTTEKIAVVGIVGEIYVKYNNFAQYDITNWLLDQHIEVAIPPLSGFFLQELINSNVNYKENIYGKSLSGYIADMVVPLINRQIRRYEKVLKDFTHYRPVHTIKEESEFASEIVSLVNQYGEGWLIPGEIASFAHHNINKVLCLQPFGCLANQVIGKGIEKRLRHHHPKVNILFLDFDYGTSRVNVLNRLHFLFKENKWTQTSDAPVTPSNNLMNPEKHRQLIETLS